MISSGVRAKMRSTPASFAVVRIFEEKSRSSTAARIIRGFYVTGRRLCGRGRRLRSRRRALLARRGLGGGGQGCLIWKRLEPVEVLSVPHRRDDEGCRQA